MRIVSLNNHPDNIVVFKAATMSEAIITADEALRQNGIQGVVWEKSAVPIDTEFEGLLRKAYKLAVVGKDNTKSAIIDTSIGIGNAQTTIKLEQEDKLKPKFGFIQREGVENKKHDASLYLEAVRTDNMKAFANRFPSVQLCIRHEKRSLFNPHYDGGKDDLDPIDENKIFGGRSIRILSGRHQKGTLIYDLKGETLKRKFSLSGEGKLILPDAWEVGKGNYLFFGGNSWGKDKALLHSSPEFTANNDEDARVLDVYDCFPK